MILYQRLATCHNAWCNCVEGTNLEWKQNWENEIDNLIKELPHGSGIDGKIEFDYDDSRADRKLVINSEFHYMNEEGFYDGWIDFKVVITPSLQGEIIVKIIGHFINHMDLKDYLQQVFYDGLTKDVII